MKQVEREILLSFWNVHMLHHAEEEPVHGQWMITELRRHGYEISPGALYPLLQRLVRHGWLSVMARGMDGGRKDCRLTRDGRKVLALPREQVRELDDEVAVGKE